MVVHIFSDIGRLADDLSAANLLPDPDALWGFVQEVCRIAPYITISDCGSSPNAVDNKIQGKYREPNREMSAPLILVQDFYSLYIENCHVRHVFLAMSPASQYYSTLQLYNDDDYTRKKTSLVDPRGGFPSGLKLAFHTARFSSLKTVPSNMTPFLRVKLRHLVPKLAHGLVQGCSKSQVPRPIYWALSTETRSRT